LLAKYGKVYLEKVMARIFNVPFIETDALPVMCRRGKCLKSASKGSMYCLSHQSARKFSRPIDDGKVDIYFIRAATGGPIKIGYAKNLDARLATLQTGCPVRLEVIFSARCNRIVERAMHDFFKEDRLHGEWFDPSEKLMAMIARSVSGELRWGSSGPISSEYYI